MKAYIFSFFISFDGYDDTELMTWDANIDDEVYEAIVNYKEDYVLENSPVDIYDVPGLSYFADRLIDEIRETEEDTVRDLFIDLDDFEFSDVADSAEFHVLV